MRISNIFYELQDLYLKRKWQKSLEHSSLNGLVLMYHNITDEWASDGISCRCPIKVFEHYLDDFAKKGYAFYSLDRVYQRIMSVRGGNLR